jgi:putative ABC transport system substrate-binding protein
VNSLRRKLMTLAIGAGCASHAALAQQQSKTVRLGYLDTTSASIASVRLDRLRAGLRDHGYVEGRNIVIEPRWAESEYARLPDLAAEKLDVIVAAGPAAIRVMRQATTTLPIVFAASGDPLMFGFVKSLSRPGGNVTGVSSVGADLSYK